MKRRQAKGFTLLEVMVALAILAISLAAVFSTEAGSIRMATRARKMGFATLLARCKMGEIEEEIDTKGMPALFSSGSDECCKDAEIEGFQCKWEIEPIIMPETMFAEAQGDGDPTNDKPSSSPSAPGVPPDAPKNAVDALSQNPTDVLSGGGDVDAIASMAMQYVYPVLKPSFESQIRRATVTVSWHEGATERSFDVTQYIVAAQPAAPPDPNDPTGTGTGTQGTGTTGSSTGATPTTTPASLFGSTGRN